MAGSTGSRGAQKDASVRTLAVILGDQLDRRYTAALGLRKADDAIVMMEVARESQRPVSHVQRTVFFLSAMRHHAQWLREQGWRVIYRSLTEEGNTHSIEDELARTIGALSPGRVVCIEPGSFRVRAEIESACSERGVGIEFREDPHFTCSLDDFENWARDRRELTMEYFYRSRRKALGVLMDEEGEPEGGSWNYDKQNRKAFKTAPSPPEPRWFEPDTITRQVIEDVREELPDLPGRLGTFGWAVTREQALEVLDDFIAARLPGFGDHQDAMWTGEHVLYHSALSPMINVKLLDPMEVVERAVDAYKAGDAPLNAVEGFVRQLIGWREFVRGVFHLEGEGYQSRNELGQDGTLPEFYWTGETDMVCVRECVGSVLDVAWGHHIARLMVLGNFALISGVEPRAVSDWFLGMYADGVDWVTDPNVIGMAMHADGGVVGTKPYAASANYINKMSNYCKGCRYDRKARTGDDACPFNTFYWDFLIRNESAFKRNQRMSLIMKHVEKLGQDERIQITVSAERRRVEFGISGT